MTVRSCLFSRSPSSAPAARGGRGCLPVPQHCPCPSVDQTNLLSKRLVDWLRYASVQQGPAHSPGGFFSTPRARQVRQGGLADPSVPGPPWPALPAGSLLPFPVFPPALVPGGESFTSQRVTAPQPLML